MLYIKVASGIFIFHAVSPGLDRIRQYTGSSFPFVCFFPEKIVNCPGCAGLVLEPGDSENVRLFIKGPIRNFHIFPEFQGTVRNGLSSENRIFQHDPFPKISIFPIL